MVRGEIVERTSASAPTILPPVRLRGQEALDRQVALARVVVETQHLGASGQLGQLLRDGRERRPRGDAHQHALFARAAAGVFASGFCIDLDHAVEQAGVQVLGDEARANALDGVGCRCAARDHGRCRGFHREYLELWELGLEHAGGAREVAAGAHAGDERVQPVGEVGQDFLGGGAHVDVDVGRVFKLLRNPRAGGLCLQFLGAGDGALHALFAGRQVKLRAVGQHQAAALNAHAVGHHQNQLVALDGGHQGQANARVARGGLDDGAAGLQRARFFCVFHHGQRNAVLDRATGVAALGFHPHVGRWAKQAVDADMGRVADGLQNVVNFHGVSLGMVKGRNSAHSEPVDLRFRVYGYSGPI